MFFSYLFARLREPSTLAGLGMLAGVFGVPVNTVSMATQVITGLAAAAAIVLPEKSASA